MGVIPVEDARSRDRCRAAVLRTVRADPQRLFDVGAIAEIARLSVLDAVLAVASLRITGHIECVAPGRYRHLDVPTGLVDQKVIEQIYRQRDERYL